MLFCDLLAYTIALFSVYSVLQGVSAILGAQFALLFFAHNTVALLGHKIAQQFGVGNIA